MTVPFIFANATSTLPLSELDTNFATPITLGNTAVTLGNTYATLVGVNITGGTVNSSNVTITGGTITNVAISNATYIGLGTMSTQNANAVTITGGTINNTSLTNVTYGGLGTMSTQNANSVTITGGTINSVASTGGSINNMTIGATTANTGAFTTLSASANFTASTNIIATQYTGYLYGNNSTALTASTTIPTTALSGSITNSQLQNSAVTVAGQTVALGGSTGVALENLSTVSVSAPVSGQILGWNGANWVNITNTQTGSAGQGVSFWNATPIITPLTANNTFQVATLSTTPVTVGGTLYSNSNPNTNTVIAIGLLSAPLGRSILDAGQYTFDIYAAVNSVAGGRTSTLIRNTYQVIYSNASAITITTSGTGNTRTATASGSFFANATASANITVSDYLGTPQGLYQIRAIANNTSATISTPTAYVNETTVAGQLWHNLFQVQSPPVTNIYPTIGLYVVQTTQPSYVINTTDSLGSIGFTQSTANTVFSVAFNGTANATNVQTPLVTLHNGLGGLQGGAANQYYHLTSAEYTGTGTGTFVRNTSPTIVTPTISGGTQNGTSYTNVSITTGTVNATYTGNGSGLTNLSASNISSGTLAVAYGGTGSANLTAGYVVLGNNTSQVVLLAPGTSGNVLTSNGTAWISNAATGGGGGSTGIGNGSILALNVNITANATINAGVNGFSVGPITQANGVSVTVSSGQRWVII
jgi:hypothetical protein